LQIRETEQLGHGAARDAAENVHLEEAIVAWMYPMTNDASFNVAAYTWGIP